MMKRVRLKRKMMTTTLKKMMMMMMMMVMMMINPAIIPTQDNLVQIFITFLNRVQECT